MSTLHETAARAGYERLVAEGGAQVLAEYEMKMRAGWWSSHYVDSICQPYRGLTPEQVFMFTRVHGLIAQGRLASVPIAVCAQPSPDRARGVNASKLAELPHPFRAEVDMEQTVDHHGDGLLVWGDSITVVDNPLTRLEPGDASLEIGSCPASRVWQYLAEVGKVARWAYGSDRIYLFVGRPTPIALASSLRQELVDALFPNGA